MAAGVQRAPNRYVDNILDGHHELTGVVRTNYPPFYPANRQGGVECLPTLVSFPGSRAFATGKPGELHIKGATWHDDTGFEEPSPDERERFLGYHTGSTRAPGLTEAARHRLLGQCMDQHTVEAILAIALALDRSKGSPDWTQPVNVVSTKEILPDTESVYRYADLYAMAVAAEELDGGPSDIWLDESALVYLRTGKHATTAGPGERKRVLKRAAHYIWSPAHLNAPEGSPLKAPRMLRQVGDGSTRVVPAPGDRPMVVQETHERCGHFGQRRTESLLLAGYWWTGMRQQVVTVVQMCEVCDRARQVFDRPQASLSPLSIRGLLYRWSIDLCGPFPLTPRLNSYCMVMVEGHCRWAELVLIPDKNSATISGVFLERVVGHYGCCAEVVTDGGGEFAGAFDALLSSLFIDHRCTHANHPLANGMADRVVQTLKSAIRKKSETAGEDSMWDAAVPYIMLGYNASVQASTGMSPYKVMFGVAPVVPPSIKERYEGVIELTDPDSAAAVVVLRAQALKECCVTAGDNMLIAQHRDTLRYAEVRSGSYAPRLFNLLPGAFVYLRRKPHNTAQMEARPLIYRIVELRRNGVLLLDGRCSSTFTTHLINVAPCHLPDIDPAQDPRLARPHADTPCDVCKSPEKERAMMMCDSYGRGFHLQCLKPPLNDVPTEDVWVCTFCLRAGVTTQSLGAPAARPAGPQLLVSKAAVRPKDVKNLVGKVACRKSQTPGPGHKPSEYGLVTFKGAAYGPAYFEVTWRPSGSKVSYMKKELTKMLVKADVKLPRNLVLRLQVTDMGEAVQNLHDHDLTTPAGVTALLGCLMPGPFATEWIAYLANQASGDLEGLLPWSAGAEVSALLERVDLTRATTFADPWGGGALVRARLARAQLQLRCVEGHGGGADPLAALCASIYTSMGPVDVYLPPGPCGLT